MGFSIKEKTDDVSSAPCSRSTGIVGLVLMDSHKLSCQNCICEVFSFQKLMSTVAAMLRLWLLEKDTTCSATHLLFMFVFPAEMASTSKGRVDR